MDKQGHYLISESSILYENKHLILVTDIDTTAPSQEHSKKTFFFLRCSFLMILGHFSKSSVYTYVSIGILLHTSSIMNSSMATEKPIQLGKCCKTPLRLINRNVDQVSFSKGVFLLIGLVFQFTWEFNFHVNFYQNSFIHSPDIIWCYTLQGKQTETPMREGIGLYSLFSILHQAYWVCLLLVKYVKYSTLGFLSRPWKLGFKSWFQ